MACDRKVIVLVSDGNQRPAKDSPGRADMIRRANEFKAAGGIIICVGIRANGEGYLLLRALSTPGFFLSVYGSGMTPVNEAITKLVGLTGYYCAGVNPTGTIVYGEEDPDPSVLPEVEFGVSGS